MRIQFVVDPTTKCSRGPDPMTLAGLMFVVTGIRKYEV